MFRARPRKTANLSGFGGRIQGMNQLFLGLMIGTMIGVVLSFPLVVWGDQIFGFLENQVFGRIERLLDGGI